MAMSLRTRNNILIVIGLIMLISSDVIADSNNPDIITITPTYTHEELDSMRIRFIKEGDSKAYTRYDFYSENIYASIGKEMDPTASSIALSYLRRSVVQGNADAIQEMQKLGKKVPYIFWHPYKKMHLEW